MQTIADGSPAATAPAKPPPILVATDGHPQSDGAIAAASLIARRTGAEMRILTVHAPLVSASLDATRLVDPSVEAARRQRTEARIRGQLRKLGCGDASPLEVRDGDPACVIARVAAECCAQLVVVGLGRHDAIDRIFGDETALKLARMCDVPLLAVPAGGADALRRVVVATDFSEVSARAAQLGVRLVQETGTVTLLHVLPNEGLLVPSGAWPEAGVGDVKELFARLRDDIDIPPGVSVEDATLSGSVAAEILRYARSAGAELVVVGSHGDGAFARAVIGSVTSRLLRGARECAVAVVPSACLGKGMAEGQGQRPSQRAARGRWTEVLDEFTRRNVGRRTRLEVDDVDIGAQPQEAGYPLLGVTYDANDDRIDIMLGDLGSGEPHLSRSIGGADAIGLLTDTQGKDVALRLRHGTGQTILTLVR